MRNFKQYLTEFWQQDVFAVGFALLSGLSVEAYFLFRPDPVPFGCTPITPTTMFGQPCPIQETDWTTLWLGVAVFFALLAVIVAVASVKEEVDDLEDEVRWSI